MKPALKYRHFVQGPGTHQEWQTPDNLFKQLDAEFRFTLDAAASTSNRQIQFYFSKVEDGLYQDWADHRVFVNPPYGVRLYLWVEKAVLEVKRGCPVVVMLLPARTDTAWFHDLVMPNAEIRWIRGRLKFKGPRGRFSAPFPSMIAVFRSNAETTLNKKEAASPSHAMS